MRTSVLCCGVLMGKQQKGRARPSRLDSQPQQNQNVDRHFNGDGNGNGDGDGAVDGLGIGNYNPNGSGSSVRRGAGSWLFARTFLKYPNMVGWMLPSSSWVVDRVLAEVNWSQARVI